MIGSTLPEEPPDRDYSSAFRGYAYVEVHEEKRKNNKKRACYRYGKGEWATKEFFSVCDTKYCDICVLKAMGSMPEERILVTCIEESICKSKLSK